VLVPRQHVHVCAAFEQQSCRIDAAEEARESEGMEAVVAEGIRERWLFLQDLAQSFAPTDRRGLEDVELAAEGEPLGLLVVAAVDRFEDVRHS